MNIDISVSRVVQWVGCGGGRGREGDDTGDGCTKVWCKLHEKISCLK